MNILFTYPSPFNPLYGGIERVTDVLTRELKSRGYNVYYLHHRNPEMYEGFEAPANVYFCPSEDYTAVSNREFYDKLVTSLKIDVIINQTGNFGDSILYNSVYPGVPVISVLHSNPLLNYDYLSEELLTLRNDSFIEKIKLVIRGILYSYIKNNYLKDRKGHLKWLAAHSSKMILLSDGYKCELVRAGVDLNGLSKVYSIPNPCSYESPEEKLDKKKQLLYVGRLTKGEKRPDRLISIWKKLYREFPDWEMVIVGDGPMRNKLEKKAAKLERIRFDGQRNPASYYREASIFCLTSNYEGFPMVLPEAMVYGAVPVAFDSFAAVHDIITNGENGVLIPPFDVSSYAEALKRLMRNDGLRNRLASASRIKSQQFSVSEIVDRWESLILSAKGGTYA